MNIKSVKTQFGNIVQDLPIANLLFSDNRLVGM
jgi:hypothetical protein